VSVPTFHCAPGEPLTTHRAGIVDCLTTGTFFWLDLQKMGPQDAAFLAEVFGFHPLALEDAEHFGQRPKMEDYDDFTFLVVYGATLDDDDHLVEVHCFYSERFLVTARRDDCPPFARLRERYEHATGEPSEPILLLYRVCDVLTDSFFPVLAELDDELDEIDAKLAGDPPADLQRTIFALKRRLIVIRKTAGPQRDLVASLAGGIVTIPGMTPEAARRFRDVYDHLIRIGDLMETYRDLLSGASDVYLATVSNRLNAVMKQLAVISTVFLPLTFVTGFFGQNFDWMVDHVGSAASFFIFGIGSLVLACLGLLIYFRRRGWL
jgi:magnesium transporter